MCILVVFTKKERKYILVRADPLFQQRMINVITDFYKKYFRPALLKKLLYKNTSELAIGITKGKIDSL